MYVFPCRILSILSFICKNEPIRFYKVKNLLYSYFSYVINLKLNLDIILSFIIYQPLVTTDNIICSCIGQYSKLNKKFWILPLSNLRMKAGRVFIPRHYLFLLVMPDWRYYHNIFNQSNPLEIEKVPTVNV